jgi:hypothetical protein
MRGLNNKIKDTLTLSDSVTLQFQAFVPLLQWLDNGIRGREAEHKGKPVPQTINPTPRAPSITHTPSTGTGTHQEYMDLSTNQRSLTPEQCQKMIQDKPCLYCAGFGYVAQASLNQSPYAYQLHGNEAHEGPFQFNISTGQTSPKLVNTEPAHVVPSFSKLVEN